MYLSVWTCGVIVRKISYLFIQPAKYVDASQVYRTEHIEQNSSLVYRSFSRNCLLRHHNYISQTVAPEGKLAPMSKPFGDHQAAHACMTFLRICKRLGIEDFRFHDLRHTAASWLRMQGADIHTVALLLGHKDLRMAARYQHLSPTFLSEAVNRLDAVYERIADPKSNYN